MRPFLIWTAIAVLPAVATAGTLKGRVVDGDSGIALPGAEVVILELQDQDLPGAELVTDKTGHFTIDPLAAGTWNLRIQAAGFKTSVRGVTVTANETKRVRFALEPVFTETLIVRALPGMRETSTSLQAADMKRELDPDLGETLRLLPGVSSVRRGPLGLDPVVRGLRETQLGVFVDGTRMFGAGPGRMDTALSHVDSLDFERVEILKGPHALTHGAGAMSAVLASSHEPPDYEQRDVGGELLAGFASAGSRTTWRAMIEGGAPGSAYSLSATRRDGRDYEDGNGTPIDGRYESTDLRFLGRWDAGSQDRLRLRLGWQGQDDMEYPGRLMNARLFRTRSAIFEWEHAASSDEGLDWELQAYVHSIEHEMDNDGKPTAEPDPLRMPPFAILAEVDTRSDTNGLRWIGSWQAGESWAFEAGFDAYDLTRNAERRMSRRDNGMVMFEDLIWPDANIVDAGAFFVGTWRRSEDLAWSLGARFDQVEADADEPGAFFLDHVDADVEQSDSNLSLTVAVDWSPAPGWTLRAGLGRVPRSANALERYSDRFPSTRFQVAAEFLGDPSLEPEVATELDVGLAWASDRVSLFADAFYRDIDDYITFTPDPNLPVRLPSSVPTVFRYVNGPGAEYYGAEAGLEVRFAEDWSAAATAAWLRGTDELYDEPALGVPPLNGTVSLKWRRPRVWIEGRVRWADSQDDVATARYEVPTAGYAVYDLLVGATLDHGFALNFSVENLTDKFFVDHLSSSNPYSKERIAESGRSVQCTVSWRF